MKITVGGTIFTTKKSLAEAHHKFLREEMVLEQVYTEGEIFDFMRDYYQQHHEIDFPITGVYSAKSIHPLNKGKYVDICVIGSNHELREHLSYKTAMKGLYGEFNHTENENKKLEQAYRIAIKSQIDSYRMAHPHCEHCGTKKGPIHVDHDANAARFVEIVRTFENRLKRKPYAVWDNGENLKLTTGYYRWRAWHRKHAVLQSLCVKCHAQADKKKPGEDRA
jgi:hypothetical protein